MHIFVAGGSGTIGIPLVRALVVRGCQVTALTRTPEKTSYLKALGAAPAVADALDRDALCRVVAAARPTHVIHQLTALPKDGVTRARDLAPTNRLRSEGTGNLLAASIAAGARRFLGGSFALLQAARNGIPPDMLEAADAMRSMEAQILDASRSGAIEGVVLRYGLFYGAGTPTTEKMLQMVRRRRMPVVRGDRGLLPFIHLHDAVSATIAALDAAPAGSVYDIVDDEPASMTDMVNALAEATGAPRPFAVPQWVPRLLTPYLARLISVRLPLSNGKARAELGWHPTYPTLRDGVRAAGHHPAT